MRSDSQDLVGRHPFLEVRIDVELDGAARQAPQLIVGPEDLRFDTRHHPRDRLVGDLRESLLAEAEEGQVGAVAQQQELEVVVPHPEVPLEGLLVGHQQIVVRGNAAPGVHVLQRLELRQADLGSACASSISFIIFCFHCA